jgi:hypothetical protein
LTARRDSLPRVDTRTPHPHTLLRKFGRSDRPETSSQGLTCWIWGLGETQCYQLLSVVFRLERPERPEIQPNARATVELGFGGNKILHALLVISGRSGRSGRDPPIYVFDFIGLGVLVCDVFQALRLLSRTRQAPTLYLRNQHLGFLLFEITKYGK